MASIELVDTGKACAVEVITNLNPTIEDVSLTVFLARPETGVRIRPTP